MLSASLSTLRVPLAALHSKWKHLFNGQFSRTLVNAEEGKVLNNIEQTGMKLGSDKSFKFRHCQTVYFTIDLIFRLARVPQNMCLREILRCWGNG